MDSKIISTPEIFIVSGLYSVISKFPDHWFLPSAIAPVKLKIQGFDPIGNTFINNLHSH